MKKILTAVLATLALTATAQQPKGIPVWPDGAPQSNGLSGEEQWTKNGRITNVSVPEIYVYPADPAKNTGAALILCPGGGYLHLAMNHEGHEMAQWLAQNGITGIVLKYRMPNGHADVPLSDAAQAVRIVRSRAVEWGVNPQKVGIGGASAGGHLAATLATHFDAQTRPDFAVLFYPVISFDSKIAHSGSAVNLVGKSLDPKLVELYSNEKQVTPETPPTVLFLSDDDRTVPPMNSIAFYQSLKANKVPASLYIFPQGGHGWGFNPHFRYHENWKDLLLKWLADRKITAQ